MIDTDAQATPEQKQGSKNCADLNVISRNVKCMVHAIGQIGERIDQSINLAELRENSIVSRWEKAARI